MTRHSSKPNKLRNINPVRGRTGKVTIQKNRKFTGFVSSKIYDKRDDFDFDIVNFPFLYVLSHDRS